MNLSELNLDVVARNLMEKAGLVRRIGEAFDPKWAPGEKPIGFDVKIQDLVEEYNDLWEGSDAIVNHLNSIWPTIENNRAMRRELKRIIRISMILRNEILKVDDLCVENPDRYFELFGDNTVMMDYVLLASAFQERLRFFYVELDDTPKEGSRRSTVYEGLAEKLEPFMTGINQKQLEDFILNDELPALSGNWIGSKRDATYFGKYFGKECWAMNRMWHFGEPGKSGSTLHYGQNSDSNVKTTDLIYQILNEYPKPRKSKVNQK